MSDDLIGGIHSSRRRCISFLILFNILIMKLCLLFPQIELDTDRDYFMNAWEARDYGIVDGVIDDGKPGLVAPIGEIKEPPKTKVWEYWTVRDLKERKILRTETSILNEQRESDEAPKEAGDKEQAAA